MANVLIAVGGSGQHTMLAYLRLARLCNFSPARLMTVDADLRQGGGYLPTTAALLEQQSRIGFRDPMFWEPVRPLPEVHDPRAQTFDALISPAPGIETELFGSLFNERQRNVRVVTGFHGHPAVASSTFRLFLTEGAVISRFAKLFEWLEPQNENRVVLAGSTSGGTGSGVMPVLADYIKKWAEERDLNLKLGGVIQVRWFDLGLPQQAALDDDKKVDVTSYDLERNSSCLVEYYRKNLANMFDSAFLVGHHPHANRKSAGVDQQPEHPHAVNLIAGYVAHQLLHGKELAENRGLLGIASPDGELQQHLLLPLGKGGNLRPLARHIEVTSGQVALGRAILNVLQAGAPSRLEVIEPYPLFVRELVKYTDGVWEASEEGRNEPAASWRELLRMQEEALRWLAGVRDQSHDIGACQFSEQLVPPSKEIGKFEVHARHLPDPLHRVFRHVLSRVRPSRLGDDAQVVLRRSFFAVRDQLETYLERR